MEDPEVRALRELAFIVSSKNGINVEAEKARVAKKYHLRRIPRTSDIIEEALLLGLTPSTLVKPSRSVAGVTVVAVMSRPFPCPPQAQCIYCPGGVTQGTPQSYTGLEPAARRGKEHNYDPFNQVISRIRHLEALGHSVSKNDVIIMGGTFLSFPVDYQEWFVKGIYDALNERMSTTLEEAIKANEHARRRCIGLTIETRPDYCREEHVDMMLRYGTTRVEIGVQTTDDALLKKVHRGHTVQDTVHAFRVSKDAGLKVVAHMMPGLPGSSPENDIKSFRVLFDDERFRPDMLKIYPTLVIKGTLLYEMYRKGLYRGYTDDEAADLVAKVLAITPPWVRIMRVQRDIPAYKIESGPRAGDLRNLAIKRLKETGVKCVEIRCREVGFLRLGPALEGFKIKTIRYGASMGIEYFISYENDDGALAGYLRLRIPSEMAHRPEVRGAAIVRELRVVGRPVPVGATGPDGWQHRGIGRMLMQEAERIAKEEHGLHKVVVISGVGVREYYMKLGYIHDGPYMSKII